MAGETQAGLEGQMIFAADRRRIVIRSAIPEHNEKY
jgi:hypothetical protein